MSANIPGSARLWRAGFGVPPKRSFIWWKYWMNKGSREKFATRESFRNRQHAPSALSSAIVLAVAILFAITVHAAEVIPPKPAGYFNDYAGVVSKEAASRFNEQLAQFERDTSDQVVVAVFPKMQSDSDIADYTQRVAQAWGVGQKERRNGVVLFVFLQDRKMFIQVGYGLEGALPDATAFDITERHIKPLFRAGNYEAGLATGIDLICKAIRGEYKGSGKTVSESHGVTGVVSNIFPFIVFIIVLMLLSRFFSKRGYSYSSRGGGPVFIPSGGGWSSSSGSSGGGFSGFSGGGGSFGGGGAGSSW
jgi:Beta-propeller domains of methanol dehydrogenase type